MPFGRSSRQRRWLLPALLAAIAGAVALGCSRRADAPRFDAAEHRLAVETWRVERDRSLRRSDGWLSLVGLHWLEDGESSFGSGEANELVFPAGAIGERAGVLRRDGREILLIPSDDAGLEIGGDRVTEPVRLALDTADDGPTQVTSGSLLFYAIERGDMIGIRVKDAESPVLAEFEGMSYFPIDPLWRLVGRYERFDEPRVLRTPNVLGTVTEEEIAGELVFDIGAETYRLQPSGDPAEGFFLVFGDLTNGTETYGGGRFLYTDAVAADGSVVVDFNKAYCPPCVFTPYATCPLPPAENDLAVRIEAGEKMFGGVH